MEELLRQILEELRLIRKQGVIAAAPEAPAPDPEPREFGREFMSMLNADDLLGAIDAHNRRAREKRRRLAA